MARRWAWEALTGAGLVGIFMAAGSAPPPVAKAQAALCYALTPELAADPTSSKAYWVVKTAPVHRLEHKQGVRRPHGVRIVVRAPQGMTAADLHAAATCSADSNSPLAVPGSQLRISRQGALYELLVTSESPAAAREIQRRAEHLR